MTAVRLQVSGLQVDLGRPGGGEDMILAEAAVLEFGLAVELVSRIAQPIGEDSVDWAHLPHSDLDALLLLTRQGLFGDLIRATAKCPAERCGSRISVTFSTAEYLRRHRPLQPSGVEQAGRPGWFRLVGTDVQFRVPTVSDLAAVRGAPRPDRALIERCVEPPRVTPAVRRRLERALERMAPALVDDVQGTCPECGAIVLMRFDPLEYCLRELRDQAVSVYDDVHVLASAYHWPEERILALPRDRRMRYAEMVRDERGLS